MSNLLGLLLAASMYLIVPALGGMWVYNKVVAVRWRMLESGRGAGRVLRPLVLLVCAVVVLGLELLLLTGIKKML